MGGSKVETGGNTTTQATPTAEETELNKMELQRQRDINPYIVPMQQQAYTLGSQLLQGKQLPGYLGSLPQGVQSEQMDVGSTQLGEDYTADLVRQSLRDIFPQFQQMGLPVESGVAQSIAGRTAGDIRRNVAETNIERGMGARQFNIQTDQANQYQNLNNLFNLLNLAVGGQAQIQAPVMAGADTLGQRLAGLRTTQTNAQGVQKNPFTGVNLGIFGTWGEVKMAIPLIIKAIGMAAKEKAKEKIVSNMSENQGKTKGGIDLTPLENLKFMMKQDRGFYKHPNVPGMKQDKSEWAKL